MIVIMDDEGKTTVVPLIRDEITIGRKEGNTIRLTERNVSRKHAKISRAGGAVAIEDLGSYNGVKVNGTRILQKVTLSISDRVQIGDYLIELKAEGAEQPAPAGYNEDARTQPIERLDPAALGALGMGPPPQPVQPMASADTDPARRAVGAASAAATTTPARLVVLSSNFAGREFAITKSPTIIGRTDDNDVVINHRSISRNHAQIVRDDAGRFTIADLQSANGVRVNGEDYGKVELRRGDTVDLGHVRLRFVEPGEDFLFGRDAQVVDVPTGGKKTWLWALLGAAVVAGVIVVVAAGGGGSKKGKGEIAAGTGTAGAGTAAVAGTGTAGTVPEAIGTIDAGEVAVAPPQADAAAMVATGPGSATGAVDTAAVNAAIADARAAVAASDWDKARERADAALKLDPASADARALLDQATRELGNENHFKDFNAAAAKTPKDYDRAVKAFEKITTDSVYKNQARGTYDQLHDEFLTSRVNMAKQYAKQKKCAELKRMAVIAGRTFPDVADEMNKVACEADQVADGPGSRPGSGPGSGPGTGAVTPPTGGATAAQLLTDANAAASASQWGRALTLAEQAMKAPGIDAANKSKAVTIAGLAACNTKNAGKAKSYYGMSPPGRQTLLRQACLKQGIELL